MLFQSVLIGSLLAGTSFGLPTPGIREVKRSLKAQTIQLSSRAVPRSDAGLYALGRRALSPSTVPLKDYFNGTDLQWFGTMSIGTPPQDVTVVFDTGSAELVVASSECGAPCSNQVTFDPTKSSTFVNGTDEFTNSFTTGADTLPVLSDDEWSIRVRNASDTITVGGMTATNVEFQLIKDQSAAFSPDPFSGIQGMSSIPTGFFAGLIQQGLPAIFSMLLTPNSVGKAEMTLGGIDESKFQGNLSFGSLPQVDGGWFLNSTGLSVNGQSVPQMGSDFPVLFDSGTPNALLATEQTKAIYAMILSDEIKPFDPIPGAFGIPCNKLDGIKSEINLQFTSQTGEPFTLTIPSSELSVGPFTADPTICQTFINGFDGFGGVGFLVGGSLLKHYYTVYDVSGQRIGFAPNGF